MKNNQIKWIPIGKRFPKDRQETLTYYSGHMVVAMYFKEGYWNEIYENHDNFIPTYWAFIQPPINNN